MFPENDFTLRDISTFGTFAKINSLSMPHKIRDDSSNKPLFYFGKELSITVVSQTKEEGSEKLLNFLNDQPEWIHILPELNSQIYASLPPGNFYILKLRIKNEFLNTQRT